MKITMLVAAHKAYRMPQDPMYLPLHVGKAGKDLELGFQGDNTGDNISEKNPTFCELTGLYWAWKNLDSDYVGLSHYRRYFRGKSGQDKWDCILTTAQAKALLQKSPVVLPKKRRYYIETAYDQYVHAHPAEPLDLALKLAADQGENYAHVVEAMKQRSWTHIYNMFLMRRDIFDGYCTWLFDILFQLEKEIDISGYSQYDRRVFGFVSERLLDVYLEANGISYIEVPVMFMEKQNWLKKGGAFLRRKFFPRKEG
jgi:hypothetical protein